MTLTDNDINRPRRPIAAIVTARPVSVLRRAAIALTSTALACCLLAQVARAANQFTIDPTPDSFGAIVTDTAGNGYLAWEHTGTGGAADTPMFCKLAPEARRCTDPVSLPLPGVSGYSGDELSANQLFPILGPGNVVWVVTSRYVADDTVIWTSTDGGRTFGGPHEIPYIPSCTESPCPPALSVSYAGLTDIDDALPVTQSYATYDRQTYLTSSGQPSVYWLESSNNPGLGFNLDDTAETYGGPAGATAFTFGNTGGGGVAGSALGTTSAGEVVEAYWLETTPPKLAYYYFREPHTAVPISPQNGWAGPVTIGPGYLPRMADGAAGMFLLSADGSGETPNAVDLRKYDTATHAFGSAHKIANAGDALFAGGGLGENYDTGELAAVWPTFGDTNDLMRLYLSTDGGSRFSPAQYVASVGGAYADFDNARVAIADNGTGFVTFQDANGLEVADLYPFGTQWRILYVHGSAVDAPVTCPSPKHSCKVTVTLTNLHGGKLAGGTFNISAGATRTLAIPLDPAALTLLAARHGRLLATLTVVVHPAGASANTTNARVTIRG